MLWGSLEDKVALRWLVRISPSTRRLASELGVEIGTVVGSGPEGAITREEIQRAKPVGTPLEIASVI